MRSDLYLSHDLDRGKRKSLLSPGRIMRLLRIPLLGKFTIKVMYILK